MYIDHNKLKEKIS